MPGENLSSLIALIDCANNRFDHYRPLMEITSSSIIKLNRFIEKRNINRGFHLGGDYMDDDAQDLSDRPPPPVLPQSQSIRPWTTGPSSQMIQIMKGIQTRVNRPNGTTRRSTALERVRRTQLSKMVRVNEDLRQEVGFAANEALQTYGGDPLMRRSGPSGMNQVELVAIIDREQRRLAALNSSIDKTQSTLVDVKLREGSEIIRLGKTKKMAQYVTMLENRLQRSLLKHNAMHAANSSLKQVQEQMRRDISFADTLQVGINQQLKTVQDQICKRAATFDEIVAHNERSRETLTVLHRSSEQWHSTFNSDWGALSQLINDQSDDFPTPIDPIQNQERLQMLLYDPELVSLRQQSGFALEEMAEKTAIVTKYNRLEQYKRTESVLRGATGIDNIDGLVNVFIDQENATFRWYSEINELAKEEEALRTAPIVATTAKDEEIGKLSWKDELVGKVEEMKGELVKVMEIDERTQTEMKEVTRKIQEMANHLVGNDKQFHLKDGLIVLEEYVHNLVQSLEQVQYNNNNHQRLFN